MIGMVKLAVVQLYLLWYCWCWSISLYELRGQCICTQKKSPTTQRMGVIMASSSCWHFETLGVCTYVYCVRHCLYRCTHSVIHFPVCGSGCAWAYVCVHVYVWTCVSVSVIGYGASCCFAYTLQVIGWTQSTNDSNLSTHHMGWKGMLTFPLCVLPHKMLPARQDDGVVKQGWIHFYGFTSAKDPTHLILYVLYGFTSEVSFSCGMWW